MAHPLDTLKQVTPGIINPVSTDSQASSFNEEYEQMIKPYIGTEYESLLRSNPYLADDYQANGWDVLSESLGLWQSPRQAVTANRLSAARSWFANQVQTIEQTEHNSKSNQVQEALEAGLNPDLAGLPDSSGIQGDTSHVDAQPYSNLPSLSLPDAVGGVASLAVNAFQTVTGMLSTLKQLNLSDTQIAFLSENTNLVKNQSDLLGEQKNLIQSHIASTDAQTEGKLQDYALNWIRRTFSQSDFESQLSDFAGIQDDDFSSLSREEKISRYLNHRALTYASETMPKSIASRFNQLVNEFSNPNSADFKSWLAQVNAEKDAGNLRSAESLNMLTAFGNGFGNMIISTQTYQMRMQQELYKYQKELFKQMSVNGVADEEVSARISDLVTKKKVNLLTQYVTELQKEKFKVLNDTLSKLDEKGGLAASLGKWALPTISDSFDAMIMNFQSSFGAEAGKMFGNPFKGVLNYISPF